MNMQTVKIIVILLFVNIALGGCGGKDSSQEPGYYTNTYPFLVSGKVTNSNGDGVGNVTMEVAESGCHNDPPAATVVEPGLFQGTYNFDCLEGTYTITPTKSNCTFTPTSRTETISSSVSNVDFTASCL